MFRAGMETSAPRIRTSDPHGRVIDYLRVSVTDRCNERCFYCMPEGYKGWSCAQDRLSADEIIAIVESAAAKGFRKIRLTGGEPLVRKDIVEIAARIWEIPGIEALGISTNATLLAPMAQRLRRAGVRAVNISLDALDPDVYLKITGGRLGPVLEGIEAAREAGFEAVKLNCVLMRGLNENQLEPLVRFAAERGCPIRFIELMPMAAKFDYNKHFLSIPDAMQILSGCGSLESDSEARLGHGPARYFRIPEIGARVGFIGAMTTHEFCGSCNKLRLTADGKLRPCLGRVGEVDVASSASPSEALDLAIQNKPLDHEFSFSENQSGRPMTAIGG